MSTNQEILEAAGRYLGLEEWPGAKSNPEVEKLFAASGHPGLTDDVPWCAAYVGAVLAEVGLIPSGSLMARSYSTWGMKVGLSEARPGDVVVFARGAPPAGHVAFFVRYEGSKVLVRGGNQGNKVSDAWYPLSSVLHIRRADPSKPSGRNTVRFGDTNASVLDLQDQLIRLGYLTGKKDGIFGKDTRAAVLSFQADNPPLETDGIVGNRTWEALSKASPKREVDRDVTKKELKEKGSTTIAAADNIDKGVIGAAGVLITPAFADAVRQVDGILPILNRMIVDNWQILLAVGILAGVWWFSQKVKAARLKAAQKGENLSI